MNGPKAMSALSPLTLRSRHRVCTRGDASMMAALKIERCEQFYTDMDANPLRLIHTERFQSSAPDSRAPEDLADCDFGWSPDRPAEGTEPRGRVNSLSVGV